jgi:hypothetical protein
MNGALDINWGLSRLATLRAGRIQRIATNLNPELNIALHTLAEVTGGFRPHLLGNTIRTIEDNGHGGAIWVIRSSSSLDGIHIGYQVQQDDRPLPIDRESRVLESIGDLAAVDGAVVLDQNIRVHGFGAFIEIPDTPRLVDTISEENKEEKVLSTKLGGGRHRSAVEFCARFAPAAAIVVSEDGRISVFWSKNSEDLFCAPLSTVGLYTGMFA